MKLKHEIRYIDTPADEMKVILLKPAAPRKVPGILWIHGGGYRTGMSEMVYVSVGKMLAERFGAVVISPEYRLADDGLYPAALEDCYAALEYLYTHAGELNVDRERIIVGGESAGGGLCAAVALYARDKGEIPIAMQLPLYPMLDCEDTESSRDNHGHVWNTKRNHWGWRGYLGDLYGTAEVPKYASPARETDYSDLPHCYTFVGDGEPFYAETLAYVQHLKEAGVEAAVDVYHQDIHAFDMNPFSRMGRLARRRTCRAYWKRIVKRGECF